MAKRYIELSRKDREGDDDAYHWGTYCLDNDSEIFALMSAVWEFGVNGKNYRAELIKKDEEEQE